MSSTSLHVLLSMNIAYSAHLVTFGNTQHKSIAYLEYTECVSDNVTTGIYGNIGVQCCSTETALGQDEGSRPGCILTSNYTAAESHCAVNSNQVLCSLEQLYYKPFPNGAAKGCEMDWTTVWSRTNCETLGLVDPATIIPYYEYQSIWHENMESNANNLWTSNGDVSWGYSSSNCPNGQLDDCVRLRSQPADSYIERTTNISQYSLLGLKFDVKAHDIATDDYCEVSYKYDDINNVWSTLWNQNVAGKYQDVTVDLPEQIDAALLSLRFNVNGDEFLSDRCYWDNIILYGILITLNPTSAPSSMPTISTLNPTASPTPFPTNNALLCGFSVSVFLNGEWIYAGIDNGEPYYTKDNLFMFYGAFYYVASQLQSGTYSAICRKTDLGIESIFGCSGYWEYYNNPGWLIDNGTTIQEVINDTDPKCPTVNPTMDPTIYPTKFPTSNPSQFPTQNPTKNPSQTPTHLPTQNPTRNPSSIPTQNPSENPSINPSNPTSIPAQIPTLIHQTEFISTETRNAESIMKLKSANILIVVIAVVGIVVCFIAICVLILYRKFKVQKKNSGRMIKDISSPTMVSQSSPMAEMSQLDFDGPGSGNTISNVVHDSGEVINRNLEQNELMFTDLPKPIPAVKVNSLDMVTAGNEGSSSSDSIEHKTKGAVSSVVHNKQNEIEFEGDDLDLSGMKTIGLIGDDEFVINGDDELVTTKGNNQSTGYMDKNINDSDDDVVLEMINNTPC